MFAEVMLNHPNISLSSCRIAFYFAESASDLTAVHH